MENNGKNIAESGLFKKILGKAEDYVKKPLRVKELLNDAYQKASEKKDVGTIAHEAWMSLQTLSRLIKAAVGGEYTGIPTTTIVGGIAVIIYFLSPIDFVPDFIPVLGLLDDVALLAWFMTSIKSEMDKFEEWEKSNQTAPTGAGSGAVSGNTSGGAAATTSTVDASVNSPKFTNYDNRDVNRDGPYAPQQVPLASPDEELRVRDVTGHGSDTSSSPKNFTAHDLDTSASPNDSSIRAASSGSGEPNVRAATTDSTRIPSSNNDDAKAGGNIR